ncbi:hypothetical protein FPRO06_06192 [Fusarium proliferatum]|nr:hypothetical protein FPRO06_06192 [Fusarium proliferatum]
MESSQDRMPIARNVRNVLKLFRTVATSFNHEIDSLEDQAEANDLRELLLTFENENIRFRIEAPHIQEQVIYLLRDISESLEDIIVLIPQQESSKGSKDIGDKPNSLPGGSDQDSEDSFTDSDLDDDEILSAKTRISTSCADIAEAIDCLLRLSLAIANPAPHERFRKLGAGPDEDVSFYEAHDVRYVQDKFPKISQDLPGVLGKFITRRRQFFKYREAHHAKLAAGLDQMTQKDTKHLEGSGVIDEDNRSDMAMSETSYATSAGYLTVENGEMKPVPPLKVPPRPPEADRGVFECATSLGTSARTPVSSQGVPNQIQTLIDAIGGSSTSPSITGAHGLVHSSAEASYRRRLNSGITFVINTYQTRATSISAQSWLAARRAISGLKSYIKHVGRHLEQLALHALPKLGDEELEDDADSGEQNDKLSKWEAISADDDSFEASPKAHGQPGADEVDGQSEISGLATMNIGHNAEGDVAAEEVPDSDTPIPPVASSSGQHAVETSDTDEYIEGALAKLEGSTKKSKKAPVGFKEQGQNPLDPTREVTQDSRPVYTRMSRKYLSLETLREFEVDFNFDVDPDYVLVKRWVPEWEQDRLWKHTKLIRKKRDKILREGTSEQRDDEPEYEWVRKSPSPLHGHDNKSFVERYEQYINRILKYNNSHFGNQSSQPGKRNQSPPPRLPSVDERERFYIRTTSRERGAPPSPSPPPQVHRGPMIEREVITHYRHIDHGALPENKDTLCRNVLIYGHCRYEDQGCAFSHDQNKNDSKMLGQGEREHQSDLPG